MPITARQRRVLDYIRRYFEVHGEPPTIAEIGKEFGMSSSASAHHVVSILEREGLIRRIPNVSRGIELVKEESAEANYEIPLLGVVAAGAPIEAILNYETVCIPRDMLRSGRMFALRVRRSEERRVGKECRARRAPYQVKKKETSTMIRGNCSCQKPMI